MSLEEKLKKAIFHYGNYFIMEMPADPDFLYHEGVAMQHCLEYCFEEYSKRMQNGSQRQFSLVDRRTGMPHVDIEFSMTMSSYSGKVSAPVVTQIRGFRNQCPPADRFIPAIMAFLNEKRVSYINHGVKNFDGQCDGELVFDRWLEMQDSRWDLHEDV